MITLTCRQARSLRGLFRSSSLGMTHRGELPPVALVADDDQPCARYRYSDMAIEQVLISAGLRPVRCRFRSKPEPRSVAATTWPPVPRPDRTPPDRRPPVRP